MSPRWARPSAALCTLLGVGAVLSLLALVSCHRPVESPVPPPEPTPAPPAAAQCLWVRGPGVADKTAPTGRAVN
jgi:hypothetical protein